MEEKKAMIFLAGELQSAYGVQKKIEKNHFDFYAADGGYLLAEKFGVPIKKVLGDFDSSEKPAVSDVLLFPTMKDETDGELAFLYAARGGYQEIWMIAPFGGRLDHTVANLCLLESAKEKGVMLKLYDGKNLAFLLSPGLHYIDHEYRYISFFPWNESAVISLKQFKYPLNHYTLLKQKPIGISNEPAGSEPSIEVHSGMVLCICIDNE